MSGSEGIFEFGPFRLEADERRLLRDGSPVPLTSKTFDTLLTLVRNHGRLVTKQRLQGSVWPDVVVDESNLTYHISILRKALGEGRTGQRYVETVPRQGYRFVADVTESDRGHGPHSGSQPDSLEWVVERDHELRSLLDAVEKAQSGNPQVRFVCGEAGVGKATLVKLLESHLKREAGVLVTTGECIEHQGEAEPYMPVLEALSRLARGDNREMLIEALRVHAPTWLSKMPWLSQSAESHNETTVGLSQERMLREIEEAIIALTSSKTLVLILSNLHWCDCSSVDFIARMICVREPARLLLLGTYRPADAKARSHPIHRLVRDLSCRFPESVIEPRALTQEAVAEYLALRFDEAVAAAVGPALYARTEGHPLFMNVILHSWESTGRLRRENCGWRIDSPEDPGDVPDTLREFIEHQIAVLTPEHREIVEAGSVARPHFWMRAIAAALGRPVEDVERECASLARAGHLVTRIGSFDYPNGDLGEAFAFTHSLYAEVIYSLLPAGRRVRLHQGIGDFLEAAFAAEPEVVAAGLATHFREGRDHRRAIRYLVIAARHALRSSAQREALVYLDDALRTVGRLADNSERERAELVVQSLRAPALMVTRGFADCEAERAYRRAVELAERSQDELKFPAAFGLAAMLEVRGEYLRSQAVLESHLPEQGGTGRYTAEWRHLLACSTFHQGQFSTALDHARKGLALSAPEGHSDLLRDYGEHPGAECHAWAGLSLWFLGCPDQALTHARRAAALVEDPECGYALANGTAQIAMLHQLRREVKESLACAQSTIESGKQQGMPYRIAIGNAIHGWARVQAGSGREAIEEIRAAIAACERIGANLDRPYFLALLAESLTKLALLDEAEATIEQAFEQIRAGRSFFYEAELVRLRGCIYAARASAPDAAARLFRKAVDVARAQSAKSLELRALISWVQLLSGPPEAVAMLDQVCRSFTEGFDTPDLVTAERLRQHAAWGGS